MITGYVWKNGEEKPQELAPSANLTELIESGCAFWLDFANPAPDEYRLLAAVFAFHPLAIEDCMHYSQRPKLEQYTDHLFLVTHVVRSMNDESVDMPEVDLFVREHYVVTVHQDPLIMASVRSRCLEDKALSSGRVDFLVHTILDTLVDSYFPALDACTDTIDSLEESIIDGGDTNIAEQIAIVRRSLLTMQHRVNPQVDILARLAQRHYSFVGESAAPYFQDVYDHTLRIAQNLVHLRELLGHAFEISLAGAAQKTNEVMRRLTLVATVFLPLTFLVGVYGMNFDYMPELTWRYGYFVIWGMMLVIAVGMWINFRRQKWL